jgi:DNA (cytosine-5)-methyltransferase 1
MQLRLGSLFSGFGGLDLAIERVFDARTVWVSDIEPGPRKVLARRFPGVPNLGDITNINWPEVEPVDIIAGGSPCQDISSAGRMAGMREGTRSNLWVEMREGIRILKPTYVIWENVSAARSTAAASAMESDPRLLGDHPAGVPALRALGRVLGDLASLGYDAQWYSLRASDVGAPHGRLRYFVLAADTARHAGRLYHRDFVRARR